MQLSLLGNGRPPKAPNMHSDSRKAQHSSFAHHRASLLFKKESSTPHGADSPSGLAALQERVRAGLLGLAPAATATPL